MRQIFVSRLTLLILSGYLVIATQVWPDNLEWMFIVGGLAMLALALPGVSGVDQSQLTINGIVGVLGIWSVFEAIIFNGSTLQWVSFSTALAGALLATVGLVMHELTAERAADELSQTSAPRGPQAPRTA